MFLDSEYFINRSTGEIMSGDEGIYVGSYYYFKNEGLIKASHDKFSELYVSLGESSGIIDGSIKITPNDTISSWKNIKDDKFINTGTITGNVSAWGTLINSGIIEGNISNHTVLMYGFNNGALDGDLDDTADVYKLNLYLKDGTIKGGTAENQPLTQATIYMDNGRLEKAITLDQTTLILNQNTIEANLPPKIEGSQNSAIKLTGSNTLTDTDKFQNIATWTIEGEWKTAPIPKTEKIDIESGKWTVESKSSNSTMNINELHIAPTASFSHTNNLHINGNVENKGTIYVGHDPNLGNNNFPQLTVNNYIGEPNSHLVFRGQLADDNSLINKLIINGNAEGQSLVTITHANSIGKQTDKGIKLIEIKGDSNAKFSLKERLLVNAYDYSLVKNGKDWYLKSIGLKPDVGAYLANLIAANELFEMRFHDRVGEPTFMQSAVENRYNSPVWVKTTYRKTRFKENQQELDNEIHRRNIQIGLDVIQGKYHDYTYLAGLTAGYGSVNTDSYNPLTGYRSNGKLLGYNVGAYASIYTDSNDKHGLYVDTWLKWNHFNADLFVQKQVDYKLKGLTAGLELGYTTPLFSYKGFDYFVQPKGQIVWTNVNSNIKSIDMIELDSDANNFKASLGLKFMTSTSYQDKVFQPFIEFNWLRYNQPYEISFGNTRNQQNAVNLAEIKAGLESKISTNLSIWLNGGYQFTHKEYRDWQAQLGASYLF